MLFFFSPLSIEKKRTYWGRRHERACVPWKIEYIKVFIFQEDSDVKLKKMKGVAANRKKVEG